MDRKCDVESAALARITRHPNSAFVQLHDVFDNGIIPNQCRLSLSSERDLSGKIARIFEPGLRLEFLDRRR